MSVASALYTAHIEVFRIGGPILLVLGTISCLINLMVFSKNSLRKNPCSIYFLILNAINLLYFPLGLLFTILAVGYNIDPSTKHLGFCRFRYYIAIVLSCWQSSCLVLASIDRTLITSSQVRTRHKSTLRLVAVSTISLGLFWLLVNIHSWFFTEILEFGPGFSVCFYQPGLYNIIMSYYAAIVNGILPPILLSIFGWWTIRNVRGIARAGPSSRSNHPSTGGINRPHKIQNKDQQLIRMLLVDISTYILCKFPLAIMLLYQQITQYNEKSAEQQLIEQSILQLTFFWYFVNNGIGCYTNILVSKTYRLELKRLLTNAPLN